MIFGELKKFECSMINLKYTEAEQDSPELERFNGLLEENGYTVNLRRAYKEDIVRTS